MKYTTDSSVRYKAESSMLIYFFMMLISHFRGFYVTQRLLNE